MALIEVVDLHKTYHIRKTPPGRFRLLRSLLAPRMEEVKAVAGVSFEVQAGEAVGYLGPNGAGKSTTVKVLTGILLPTRGAVHVNGLVPWRDRFRNARQMGVVFGQRNSSTGTSHSSTPSSCCAPCTRSRPSATGRTWSCSAAS